jgi:predicted ribonuclease toxin of YeeF-YezG toxin-antitoxin module
MMGIDFGKTLDAVGDGVKNVGEVAHKSMENFHKNYVSKITPKDGKFGDATKFVAEMVPGVSEYNAVREGDWKAFAIAGGIDVALIGVTVATAGLATGAAVCVKAGTEVGKTAVKTVIGEGTEAVAKKAIKEGNEAVAEKTVHEGVEAIAKKTVKKGTEEVAEKTFKETGRLVVKKTTIEVGQAIDKTRFPEYLKQIEKITDRVYPKNQKELIDKAIKDNDYFKLSPKETAERRQEFNKVKNTLIGEWEKNTGEKWPIYDKDMLDDAGNVLRRAGQPFDAHHVIENSVKGPHEWWNIFPARFPNEHQGGIHAAESLSKKIFG